MTIHYVYNIFGFLTEKQKVSDLISQSNNNDELDYDPVLSDQTFFNIDGTEFSITNFSHDTTGFEDYCVIGLMLCKTPISSRAKMFYAKNKNEEYLKFRENHNKLTWKKIQTLTYYLASKNLPFDIISLICDMVIKDDDILLPLYKDKFWSRLIENTEPQQFFILDDCDCCS